MFTKRIIPCLDVNNGRVVKGINFVNLRDAGDPVEIQLSAYLRYGKSVGCGDQQLEHIQRPDHRGIYRLRIPVFHPPMPHFS